MRVAAGPYIEPPSLGYTAALDGSRGVVALVAIGLIVAGVRWLLWQRDDE